MANPLLLSFSISFLLLFHGSLARHQSQQHGQDQCQLNMLEAREPDNRIEAEAGLVESWNPNHDEFQCVGVAVARYTVEQNGLHLPSYYNAPVLIHVVQGRALLGVLFPGCPETFEESQQESQQQGRGQQGQQGRGQQGRQGRQFSSQQEDRHQKIRRIREGDIIAIPAGVAFWTYNEGDQQLITVDFIHTDNEDNQLDQNPRRFYLAGNPEDAFNQQQSRRSQQGRRQGQQGNGNNVYSGLDTQLLADALNIDEETARKLQGENDNRKNIIKVQGKLDTVTPQRSRQERQEEQRLQEELQQERQQQGRGNGLEETFCSARLKENIADPSRADVYSPRAGRVTTVNSFNLPILRSLGLSAERGFLYQNAFYTPHWNINAHSIIYAIRGSARVQVVDDNGNNMFDQELRQGQVLAVPQNFVVMKKASNEGFEWVSFKTNDRATMTPLSGRVSALRALPDDVVSNIFQLSRDEAKQVKFNRRQVSMLDSSSSQRRLAF